MVSPWRRIEWGALQKDEISEKPFALGLKRLSIS
jgi:hypothetical protein